MSRVSNRAIAPQQHSAAERFDRSVKRDPTLFSDLQNIVQWDSWSRMFETQVKVQGCSNVIDDSYTPATQDERELFQRQQLYIYSIFERTLKIDDGKDLVRKHHSTHDAQRVYTDLKAFALKSTAASLNAADLLTYITSARLGDNSSWVGSASGFITHLGKPSQAV